MLRVIRGTLAELVGAEALPVDRLSRRIGFRCAAELQLKVLDDEIRTILEAFARGVNDGSKLGCRRRAHEFSLLRAGPTPYESADVLGMMGLQSFLLGSCFTDLARLKILNEDGHEALKAMETPYPEWLPVSAPIGVHAGRAMDRLAEDLVVFMETVGHGGGSNNWALAPSRTATGRPIMANDVHLGPVLPQYWYLAHVRTPDWTIAGASFAGGPIFPAGYNGVAAWGITAGCVDNADLFLEKIGPDGLSVLEGDQFVNCETRFEVIQVKGGNTIEEEVLITPRGPIIGPALEGEVDAISLRANWLFPRPVRGLLQLHRVHTFEEFRSAFKQWPGPSLNIVYTDTSGTVGWQMAGDAPRRRKGCGTIPIPGWDLKTGWEDDPIQFDQMPHMFNPGKGFVATANNRPTPEGKGPFLGVNWFDGYRLARIAEALDERRDWDMAGVQALQMDQLSIPWRELRDIVNAIPARTDEASQAITLLKAWDGVISADSPAAAVFEMFLAEMIQRMVQAKAPHAAQWALGKGFNPLIPYSGFMWTRIGHMVSLLQEQPEGWFKRPWSMEIMDALGTVVRNLRKKYGSSPQNWAWGHVRSLTLRHPVGDRKPLDRIFNVGPFPWGGDTNTVGLACINLLAPDANPLVIASLRMVVDVGNWEKNSFSLPGGQSGNPLSPHYSDLLPFWQRGEGVSIAWSQKEVAHIAKSTLRLLPG
ncbi:Acyl-homoserine lactone acylase QuiP [subsurface metagenome]